MSEQERPGAPGELPPPQGLGSEAMQTASTEASLVEHQGETDAPGLTSEQLIKALDQQVRGLVDGLHESNVGDYLDLPDGVRIACHAAPARANRFFPMKWANI